MKNGPPHAGHNLKRFCIEKPNYVCDGCKCEIAEKCMAFGCHLKTKDKRCSYDLCQPCVVKMAEGIGSPDVLDRLVWLYI